MGLRSPSHVCVTCLVPSARSAEPRGTESSDRHAQCVVERVRLDLRTSSELGTFVGALAIKPRASHVLRFVSSFLSLFL